MASITNTAFEVSVSNITRNETQNITGIFGAGADSAFKSEICPSGFLCTRQALLPNAGYEGIVDSSSKPTIMNGNAWEMIAATNGVAGGMYGDHTGIYAFNSYDVRKVQGGNNVWMLGNNYLGLELPANERGTFTEIIIGEQYTFGAGNFSTAPTGPTYIYATIANGQLVASATAPAAATGVYFKILREKNFTVGTRNAGFKGYVCQALRTAEAAPAAG